MKFFPLFSIHSKVTSQNMIVTLELNKNWIMFIYWNKDIINRVIYKYVMYEFITNKLIHLILYIGGVVALEAIIFDRSCIVWITWVLWWILIQGYRKNARANQHDMTIAWLLVQHFRYSTTQAMNFERWHMWRTRSSFRWTRSRRDKHKLRTVDYCWIYHYLSCSYGIAN